MTTCALWKKRLPDCPAIVLFVETLASLGLSIQPDPFDLSPCLGAMGGNDPYGRVVSFDLSQQTEIPAVGLSIVQDEAGIPGRRALALVVGTEPGRIPDEKEPVILSKVRHKAHVSRAMTIQQDKDK